MSEAIIPIVAGVSVAIFKIVELITKKSYRKINYKKIKRTLYKAIKESFKQENIEKLKENIDLLKDFDEKNSKEKLPKLLIKLGLDPNNVDTLEDISNQFENIHNKANESSKVIEQFDLYFDTIKKDFMDKLKNNVIKE